MNIKNPFSNREFDLGGLIQVLIFTGISIIAFLLAVAIISAIVLWPWLIAVAILIVAVVIPLYIAIHEAFNLIFPKKVDKEQRLKELNEWLYGAANAYEEEDKEHD